MSAEKDHGKKTPSAPKENTGHVEVKGSSVSPDAAMEAMRILIEQAMKGGMDKQAIADSVAEAMLKTDQEIAQQKKLLTDTMTFAQSLCKGKWVEVGKAAGVPEALNSAQSGTPTQKLLVLRPVLQQLADWAEEHKGPYVELGVASNFLTEMDRLGIVEEKREVIPPPASSKKDKKEEIIKPPKKNDAKPKGTSKPDDHHRAEPAHGHENHAHTAQKPDAAAHGEPTEEAVDPAADFRDACTQLEAFLNSQLEANKGWSLGGGKKRMRESIEPVLEALKKAAKAGHHQEGMLAALPLVSNFANDCKNAAQVRDSSRSTLDRLSEKEALHELVGIEHVRSMLRVLSNEAHNGTQWQPVAKEKLAALEADATFEQACKALDAVVNGRRTSDPDVIRAREILKNLS